MFRGKVTRSGIAPLVSPETALVINRDPAIRLPGRILITCRAGMRGPEAP